MAGFTRVDDAFTGRVGLRGALLDQGMKFFVAQLREDGELRKKLVIPQDFAW
jgi:hypothetical protein